MQRQIDNILFVPIVHRRVTFAEQVRRAALDWRPDVIAVELPATLEEWIVRGVMRLPRLSAVCWEEAQRPGELSWLPIDPCDGLIEAVRLGCTHAIELAFIDLDLPGLQDAHLAVPDDLIIDKAGYDAYINALAPYVATAPGDPASVARENAMARSLKRLAATHERVLCVVGLGHWLRLCALMHQDAIEPAAQQIPDSLVERPGAVLADLAPESLTEALGEMPYLTWLFEQKREDLELVGQARFDKLAAVRSILKKASETYRETYKETINVTQWKGLMQFMRNLTMVRGRLRPDLYELIIGARGIVDGDFGYEVFELARSYPLQDPPASDGLPRLRMREGRGALEGREERFRLRPRWESAPAESVRVGFRRRPSKRMRALWREQWDRSMRSGICSWPPEDDVQERFMDFLRKRALQVLTEDRRQVQEFSTSLLDGLDVRETVRQWHTGKLYVQATPPPMGQVGAVVLIFEDVPLDDGAYDWRTTLFAEHQNESDISFYAEPLGQQVVGPRICRTEFGGLLSVFPAWGIPDIWTFDIEQHGRTCSEALTLAGILFSPGRFVAYVAAKPPSRTMAALAAQHGRHLIYLPLHMFSPSHIKKIRRFHILDGHDVRQWARDYIFED